MAQTKVATTQEKAVVKWKGEQITVTFRDVKTLICPYATDQETAVFLKTCQSLQLNPFANEIYLIKYSEREKAATVISIDSYLKSAESNNNFDGHEAGIVLRDSGGKLDFREGSLILPDETEKIAGGWARVYRKDRGKPFYMAVNKAECLRYTRDGKLTRFWAEEKQPSMLRKTALKRALVEAFPSLFAGTMATAEVVEEPEAEYQEMPEGELPPAYERNGEAYWKKFWARQKEKGLTTDDVHRILEIRSLKEEWLEQGKTLEEAEEIINATLVQEAKKSRAGWPALWERAKQLGISQTLIYEMLGVTSVKEWTDRGKTIDDAIKVITEKITPEKIKQQSAAEAVEGTEEQEGAIEGEDFHIDRPWLTESQQALKWSDDTCKTFLVSKYKVSPQGTLPEVINRLTREQAEDFVNEINKKLEKQKPLF